MNHTPSNVWINDIDLRNCSVSADEKQRLLHLLTTYEDVFVKSKIEFGQAHRFSHSIDTGEDPRLYRIPYSQLGMVDVHIEEMLDKGLIKESNSPWSHP